MRERKPLKVDGSGDVSGDVSMDGSPDGRTADTGARTLRPESAPESAPERPVGANEIRRAALEQGFASDGRRRRSVHTGTVAFKVRPGMPDLLEDICYLKRLKKQELFEEMLAAWLDAADVPELTAKYGRITGRRVTGDE